VARRERAVGVRSARACEDEHVVKIDERQRGTRATMFRINSVRLSV
jgi:hypothetical protein